MTYRIAYGTDTGTLEDPDQLVLVSLPDSMSELDNDDLTSRLSDGSWSMQPLVGMHDVLESMSLAMTAEGVSARTINHVLMTVKDAVDNS